MYRDKSRTRDIKVGDLVTHVLYGREWIGVVISFHPAGDSGSLHNEKALVQMQPGTKYDGFFEKRVGQRSRVAANLGYVSVNWLFRVIIRNEEA